MKSAPVEKWVKDAAGLVKFFSAAKAKNIKSDTAQYARCCDTPIERALAVQFVRLRYELPKRPPVNVNRGWSHLDWDSTFDPGFVLAPHHIYILCQQELGPYRVDFLVMRWVGGVLKHRLVVECDGHDFHERSKEQAARDHKRDRDLTLHGLKVIRFTGSEIHRAPDDCLMEIVNHITTKEDFAWD